MLINILKLIPSFAYCTSILDFTLFENGVLKNYYTKPYSNKGIINKNEMKKRGEVADHVVDESLDTDTK